MTAPDHLNLESEVYDLFVAKMHEFAAFCRENWQLTEAEIAQIVDPQPHPDSYRAGYNAAITDGIDGALAYWLHEIGYA